MNVGVVEGTRVGEVERITVEEKLGVGVGIFVGFVVGDSDG
jgi:hypothetical protein